MALTNGKGRLVSDPSIGVSDLMAPLQAYMQTKSSRDLELILEIPRGTSWKTAINCEWLATVSSLFQGYAKVAPNTMLPPKKHRAALAQLHQEGKINFSRKSDADFFDYVDEMLRVCFSQFRQLAQSPDACERAFRKASPIQVKAIEDVLSMLTVGKEKVAALVAQEEGGVCGQDSAPTLVTPGALNKCVSSEECLAVVPAEAPAPRPKQPASLRRMGGFEDLLASQISNFSPAAIFEAVLAGPGLETLETEEELPCTPPEKAAQKSERSPLGFEGFLSQGDYGPDADKLLQAAVETVPIGENGQCQLQIFRNNSHYQNKKKSKKGKGKGKGQSKGPLKSSGHKVEKKSPGHSAQKKCLSQNMEPEEVKPGQKTISACKNQKNRGPNMEPKGRQDSGQKTDSNHKKKQPKLEQEDTQRPSLKTDSEQKKKQTRTESNPDAKPSTPEPPAFRVRQKRPEQLPGPAAEVAVEEENVVSRTVRRKRFVSRAWHTTYDAEISRGTSKEQARAVARAAFAKAAEHFDKKEPRSFQSQAQLANNP